ncbi:MAG TPA: DUF6174 domain-containing protein [Steroidobacteraceae bacterium]|nr:DUF6174 domain-containing protein [Steroidobacteraceae bacterium]
MGNRAVILCCAATLLPLLAGADDCSTKDLQAARARWAAAKIDSYAFTMWAGSPAWNPSPQPIRMTISKGELVSAVSLRYYSRPGPDLAFDIVEGNSVDTKGRDYTIPGLLTWMEKDLQQQDIVAQCRFHPELGFPLTYSMTQKFIEDGNYALELTDFEVLQ